MSVTASNIQGTDWTADVDENYRASISVKYRVTSNSLSDGPATILAGARSASPHPVPQHYATYAIGNDSDVTLFARTFSVRPAGKSSHSLLWDVVVGYAPLDKKEPGDDNPVPTERPVKWGGSFELEDAYVTKDKNDVPIINNAGLEYNPPAIRPKPYLLLTARQNVSDLSTIIARTVKLFGTNELGTVNVNAWNGVPAKQALFLSPTIGDIETQNGVSFYPVTWRFRIGNKPWVLTLVERGNLVRYAILGEPNIYFKDGVAIPGPHNLDANGLKLGDGEPIETNDWEIYEEMDFQSELGF